MNRSLKETNIPWIGQVPEDWSITKIGTEFKLRNNKVDDISFPPLSVTKQGIVPQLDTAAKTDAHDNRKQVLAGDFVINSRSDRKQSCGLSTLSGSVSLINSVLFQKADTYGSDYVGYLFKNYGFAEEFYRWGHGIVADLWTTGWDEMKGISIPLPSKDEQVRIVKAIKSKEEKINALITNEEKQIEKLKAYKQALISEVVTKGLDPNVPMKDSGVEWIGKIPVDWSCHRFKFIINSLRKGSGITKDLVNLFGDIQCIRYGEIYSKYDEYVISTFSKTFLNNIKAPQFIKKGELLFACTGELVEEIGKNIAYMGDEPCLAGGDIIIANHSQNPRFLNYALNSQYSQKQKSYGKAKLKVVHIYSRDIANLKIAIPNSEVQKSIADYLDNLCLNLNDLINNKLSKIDYLKQYRQSIIYEYVTGKKEV